ncbi:MAG: GDSL-type esterase/lipase family protein [Kiritimatiellae bacterium]|nr:GDSL-type esterase/lipase family protein [Kiritimatiellia bacterium]MDD5522734.1 GDSL-type esterase/lipase family protein [Kiritimatiellia bacterium]
MKKNPSIAWFIGFLCLLLSQLALVQSATTTNTAVIPVPKLENDSYDWYKRHEEILVIQKQINPQIVMIGDSITHFWGGEPKSNHRRGTNAWSETFGNIPVLNMGFGWDRTQNVLWRLDHGEFDGLHPKKLVLNIGTNNFSPTKNARANSPEEICEGIIAICEKIKTKSPNTKIIVMGVLPRGNKPDAHWRPKIKALNQLLPGKLKGMTNVTFLDIGEKMLEPDGTLSKGIMPDGTHPNEKGYSIWGNALVAAGVRD